MQKEKFSVMAYLMGEIKEMIDFAGKPYESLGSVDL
jgi:hypothetical protein